VPELPWGRMGSLACVSLASALRELESARDVT
jgi:hypothetical protein